MTATAKYQIDVDGQSYEVTPAKNNALQGTIDGDSYQLDLQGNARDGFHLLLEDRSMEIQILEVDYAVKTFTLGINGESYQVEAKDRFDRLLKRLGMEDLGAGAVNDLKAPMPGLVLETKVEAGAEVSKGQPLVVLEAMKMENVLKAEADAVVKEVAITKGEAVEKNQILVSFES